MGHPSYCLTKGGRVLVYATLIPHVYYLGPILRIRGVLLLTEKIVLLRGLKLGNQLLSPDAKGIRDIFDEQEPQYRML
ncbi:MAG: hypothetical protein JW836_10320 [Deltaproteobacteria bacterium]|nr:hypothetical protein [Deltaproteobacteria bacterium]